MIQFAKLSGFSPIITVASKSNEAHLKSLGATHVIDRTLPFSELPGAVKQLTKEPIKTVFDAVASADTQHAAYEALSSGGTAAFVLNPVIDKSKLSSDKFIVNIFGNVHVPSQREIGLQVYNQLTELLAAGNIKVSVTALSLGKGYEVTNLFISAQRRRDCSQWTPWYSASFGEVERWQNRWSKISCPPSLRRSCVR